VVQSNKEWSFRPQGQLNESNWKKICPTPNPKPQTQQNPEIEIVASTYPSIRTSVPIFSPSEIRILQATVGILLGTSAASARRNKNESVSPLFSVAYFVKMPRIFVGSMEYLSTSFGGSLYYSG
jgi:hypothetical protein